MLLDNLISNACKYTMPRGEIYLILTYTKRKAIIEVKDSGIGIPKKTGNIYLPMSTGQKTPASPRKAEPDLVSCKYTGS